jgi:hypothetical protein
MISQLYSKTDWLQFAGKGPRSDKSIKGWHEAISLADRDEYVNFRIDHANALIRKEQEYFARSRKEKHLLCYWDHVQSESLHPGLSIILSIPGWARIGLKRKRIVAASIIGNIACAVRAMMIGEDETNLFRQILGVYQSGYFVCGAKARPDGTYRLVAY